MPTGAFDLLDRPLVYLPVKWFGTGADENGSAIRVEHVVDIQVELLDVEEFGAWMAEYSLEVPDDQAAAHALSFIKRIVKGWRRVKAGNREVPFTDENLAKLIRWPGFTGALGTAYADAWRGEPATREGNSDGSLGNGAPGEPTAETQTGATSKS